MTESQGIKKASAFVLAIILLGMGFAVCVPTEAEADFVDTASITVPWTSDFTPLDSAWDSTGNHCIVVGNDVAATPQSNAWYYNSGSNAWAAVSTSVPTAQTWNVGSGAGNYTGLIQVAVNAANPGDTVFVWPGTYAESVFVNKAIDIVGYDKSTTFLELGGISGHGFHIVSNWVNVSGFTVRNSVSPYNAIYLDNNGHCSVSVCNIDTNNLGIMFWASGQNNISYNVLTGNMFGLYLYNSLENSIYGNSVSGSTNTGLHVQSSSNNALINNFASSNYDGIYLEEYSDSNLIQGNTVSGNSNFGIFISEGTGNTVRGNMLTSNNQYGMRLAGSPSNVITGNTLNNNYRGLWVSDASTSGNQIYLNNFLSSTLQNVYDPNLNINSWHLGDPATGGEGGNYYLGYAGVDRGDGIGSTPYGIASGGSQDMYPWTTQDGWLNDRQAAEWHFSEGAGQSTADSSGNGNNGQLGSSTLVDGLDPTWTAAGISGSALDYKSDYVRVPHSNSLNLGEYFSMEGWVKEPDFSVKLLEHYMTVTNIAVQNQVAVSTVNPGEVRLATASGSQGPFRPITNIGGSWVNPTNIMTSDNLYTTVNPGSTTVSVSLSGDNGLTFPAIKTFTLTPTEQNWQQGSSADTWGKAWTASEINTAFRFRITTNGQIQTYSNFGFTLPAGCTITGIVASLEGYFLISTTYVDYATVTVYYTNGYSTIGQIISTNLLPSHGGLKQFETSVTAMPVNTGVSVLFSRDNALWYNSAGVLNAWQSLPLGYKSTDLSGLGWTGSGFYYKIQFTSDGLGTPVLDWVNTTYISTSLTAPILSKFNSYELRVSSQMMYGRLYISGSWSEVSAGITWATGWNYFAFTSAGSLKILYHNGISVLTNTLSGGPAISTYPLYFGSYNAFSPYLVAKMDEAKLWNRTITSVEVQDRYYSLMNFPVNNINTRRGYSTIQAAINDATTLNGHTISVAAGTYYGTVNINKQLTLIGDDRTTTTINAGGVGNVIEVTASNVHISQFALANTGNWCYGVYIYDTDNCIISDINMNTYGGICILYGTGGHLIETCSISSQIALQLEQTGGSATIQNNYFMGAMTGLNLYTSHTNTFTDNTFQGTGSNNGVYIESSNQNIFCRNMIFDNDVGVYIDSGSNNAFYNNNFINNNMHVQDWSGINTWSLALPTGGNHWDDWTTPDTDADGIVDSPRIFSGNQDLYPWAAEDGWLLDYSAFQPLNSVGWDGVHSKFWVCGEYAAGAISTCYYIPVSTPTSMISVLNPPTTSFSALAVDNLGNILVGGDDLNALYYYDGTNAHQVTESTTGSMMGWDVNGISFNPADNRFYVVGETTLGGSAVAFFTDTVPLTGGAAKCYRDTSAFMNGASNPDYLYSLSWNPLTNYGIAVGEGVFRVEPYDGNPGYELSWSVIGAPQAGRSYYDVSWDSDGWNEAGISGKDGSFGTYWRYYNTNPFVLSGYTSTISNNYPTCAMKPPSSPKWLILLGAGEGVRINISEKDESGTLSFSSNLPHTFSFRIWKQADLLRTNLADSQIDPDSTYTFFIEGNYTINGVDNWNNLWINVTAWYDQGILGAASEPGDSGWSNDNFRTRQFSISCNMLMNTYVMNYPTPPAGDPTVREFYLVSYWRDPSAHGTDGKTHHLYLNVSIGPQTYVAAGDGPFDLPGTNLSDKNLVLNDQFSWDTGLLMENRNDNGYFNKTYMEFGIKKFASISSIGNPTGSAPPGTADFHLSNPLTVHFSSNTPYFITLAIPDLHLNGDMLDPHYIPATNLDIRNLHTTATGTNSDISLQTQFASANTPLYVWGLSSGVSIATSLNGMETSAPFYTDYSGAITPPFEHTVIDWWIDVPVGISSGQYSGTITLTIKDTL